MASHYKQYLIWATVSAISEWWNWFCEVAAREHLYQKHPSGRFGFHCYFQFSCEDGVWVTESGIMSSIVVNIQYHIVKYIGILCLWGSFILRFLFYFCCVLIDGDNAAMMTARHRAFAPREWMATINMIQKKSAPCFEIRKKSTPCFEIFAGR